MESETAFKQTRPPPFWAAARLVTQLTSARMAKPVPEWILA